MEHNYSVIYDKVQLMPLTMDDAEQMRLLRNRNSARFVTSDIISSESQRFWYEKYLHKDDDYMFSVYYMPDNIWVGAVGVYDVDCQNAQAEFGRLLIDAQLIGVHGLGFYATMAACRFAFEQLGIKKLNLEVYCDNAAAIITYLKARFVPRQIEQDCNGRSMLLMDKIKQ